MNLAACGRPLPIKVAPRALFAPANVCAYTQDVRCHIVVYSSQLASGRHRRYQNSECKFELTEQREILSDIPYIVLREIHVVTASMDRQLEDENQSRPLPRFRFYVRGQ